MSYGKYGGSSKLCDQDELRFGVTTAIASLIVGCSGLMRNENGDLVAFDMRIAPTSDRVETVLQQNIGAGTLLHCHAYLASGTMLDRGCYVNARIIREAGAIDNPQFTLLSGYLDNGLQPSFPYGEQRSSLDGPGRIRSITGTNPAVGVEISETVPVGVRWRLIGISAQLVTDATVSSRTVVWQIDDGATVMAARNHGSTQAASLTVRYSLTAGADTGNVGASNQSASMTDSLTLAAGFRINTLTSNLQAGDNWGAPQLWVEEWLTP